MVKLDFMGMCEGCKYADLKLERLEWGSYGKIEKEWSVRCEHADACDAMESRTIERVRNAE